MEVEYYKSGKSISNPEVLPTISATTGSYGTQMVTDNWKPKENTVLENFLKFMNPRTFFTKSHGDKTKQARCNNV